MAGLIPTARHLHSANPRFFSFYNMLDDFFNEPFPAGRNQSAGTFKLDVLESEGEYCIEAELPGVNREDIELTADEGRFTISVKKTGESSEEKSGYVHRERYSSSMARSVYLADGESNNVNAKLENGILSVRVPKQTPIETKRQIEIL